MAAKKKLTLRDIARRYKEGRKLVSLSLYDALMARFADSTGVDILLVGDSMGMTILGYKNTVAVTLEQSLHHTAAVSRGTEQALVIGDMPFLSYQINDDETIRNAGRYIQEAGADGVKLEGGQRISTLVQRMVDCGIPVLGHIGLLPQRILVEGGYAVKGKSETDAKALQDDALALQDAGAFGIILESIPESLGQKITEFLEIPTIGIGAGPQCSGQIQVAHDILGLFEDWVPKHSKQYRNMAQEMREVFQRYKEDVEKDQFSNENK